MKIANVMLGRGLGGIEQAVVDYSEAISLAGHEAFAIVHPHAKIIETLKQRNIAYFTLENLGAWDFFAIRKLRALLDRQGVEVSIGHGNRAVSLLTYSAKGTKIVAVTHNYKIKCRGVTAVFCPTQDLIRHTLQQTGRKTGIYHVPNMVRVPQITANRTRHTPPVIGTMGRFVAKKGFDVFIESLAILKSRNIDFHAIIGGGGEEENILKSLALTKDLKKTVSFPGWIRDKEKFFADIDLFCLPSHHEPFGIVLLEAMAQGLPVISTASEGPSEILDNGINGLLTETGNAEQLAHGLQQLIADSLKAAHLGEKAFETVKNSYDLPVISQKLDLALKSL